MAEKQQLSLISPADELESAKRNPHGQHLPPAAQAIYEREGAERFRRHHPAIAKRAGQPAQGGGNG